MSRPASSASTIQFNDIELTRFPTTDTQNGDNNNNNNNSNGTTNKAHSSSGTPPLLPITFFFLSVLLFVTFNGDLHTLSLVFAMSFLTVLGMYALCCIILRVRIDRESNTTETAFGFSLLEQVVPPEELKNVSGSGIILAAVLVILTIVGNAIDSPKMLTTFLAFFSGFLVVITCVLNRVQIARVGVLLFFGSDAVCSRGIGRTLSRGVGEPPIGMPRESGFRDRLYRWVKESREKPVAYFTNGESLHHLNQAILHVLHSEPTSRLIIVHLF
ncbi:hypothetical protein BDR26DRAFT_652681 [Obelidium mucronatum]|nr:hypothetical protein BDR26DRAFT_652681 [Obelidium mucronatum]